MIEGARRIRSFGKGTYVPLPTSPGAWYEETLDRLTVKSRSRGNPWSGVEGAESPSRGSGQGPERLSVPT
ncbi:hypothetical protein AGMMS49992_09680 [Clostridia bacterium]|nr:hypothetical protein AGMMS49992_09680 [Clostridia bacterium]